MQWQRLEAPLKGCILMTSGRYWPGHLSAWMLIFRLMCEVASEDAAVSWHVCEKSYPVA